MPCEEYFFIRSQLNGLVLDVQGDSYCPGTRVITWPQKSKLCVKNQLWRADIKTGTIRSKLNDYCLTIEGDTLVVQPYEEGNPDQQWMVCLNRIQNRCNPSRVLDIAGGHRSHGARVCAYEYHGGAHQHWDVEIIGPNYFFICSQMNCKVVDVKGSNRSPGTPAIMYTKKTGSDDNQLWYQGLGGVILSKLNDFALDASFDEIRLQPYNPSNCSQQWVITEDRIENRNNPNEVVDITGSNPADGATLCAYQYHGQSNQRWGFEYI